MHDRRRVLHRSLAVGAALTMGMGGALIASPAFADDGTAVPVAGAAYEAQAQELLGQEGVEAVGRDAGGNLVVVTVEGSDSPVVDDLDAGHSNVVVREVANPLTSFAATDVVGGAGYLTAVDVESTMVFACSIGFTAWTPEGDPALLSAGHCTGDGTRTITALTRPSTEPAVGGAGYDSNGTGLMGEFGFSQYGLAGGDHTGGDGDLSSIDISVIDVENPNLDLLPEVTDWTTAAADDLAASTVTITKVGKPVVGQPVAKSGRTTGYTDGVNVDMIDGWANIDGRYVHGFSATGLVAGPGDSGGAVIQGNTAVGLISGGDEETGFTWAAELQNALQYTGGYTVMLYIEAPILTSPSNGGDVERGAAITGTAPSGTTLVVTPDAGAPFEVTVDGSGTWSFPAPAALGSYAFSVMAKNGFNESESSDYSVNVVPAPLLAPGITSPANGSPVSNALTEVTGTGLPGATVTVSGDVEGTTTVESDGTWSIEADLGYGDYEISVVQESEGQTSPAAASSFSVVVPAPVITSPADGSEFAVGAAPTVVSGTGEEGATISAAINGEALGETTVVDGMWEFSLDGKVREGLNAIAADQTIDGVSSGTAQVSFTLASPAAPAAGGTDVASGLANTGADVSPFLTMSAMLFALGAAAIVFARRRKGASQH